MLNKLYIDLSEQELRDAIKFFKNIDDESETYRLLIRELVDFLAATQYKSKQGGVKYE